MRVCVVLLVMVLCNARCDIAEDGSFLGRFRYGLELVQQMFSSEPASHFRAFFSALKRRNGAVPEKEEFVGNLFSAVLKSITGSQKDMTIAGVKISVLVAKMISDTLPPAGRTSRKVHGEDSLLSIVLSQPQIKRLLTHVQDPNLTEKVLGELKKERNSDCVQLLICKMSPFVHGMQKSLKFFTNIDSSETERTKWAESTPIDRMHTFLPAMDEFLQNGDACDDRHPSCVY